MSPSVMVKPPGFEVPTSLALLWFLNPNFLSAKFLKEPLKIPSFNYNALPSNKFFLPHPKSQTLPGK